MQVKGQGAGSRPGRKVPFQTRATHGETSIGRFELPYILLTIDIRHAGGTLFAHPPQLEQDLNDTSPRFDGIPGICCQGSEHSPCIAAALDLRPTTYRQGPIGL